MKLRKMINTVAIGVAVLLAVLQFVRPDIPARRATAEVEAPPAVRHILEKSCYGCHSYERRLAWFDEIQPGYWLVRHDILTARERLNFSTLGSHPSAEQKAKLYEAVNMIQLGAMPLPRFASLHPEARVTPEDLATLKTYLAPWKPMQAPAQAAAPALCYHPPFFSQQCGLNRMDFSLTQTSLPGSSSALPIAATTARSDSCLPMTSL